MNYRICIALIVLAALCGFAAAVTDDDSDPASQISVTGITKSPPETLMPGDQGFITVKITNSGEESASIDRAKLYTDDLVVVNDNAYEVVGDIGAKNSMEFTFLVEAGPAEGIFYPSFYLDFGMSGSLRTSIPVIVDDTAPQVSLLGVPETFTDGKTEDITVRVGNTRDGELSAVTITPVTDGIMSDQTSYFVGVLRKDESAEVPFAITPPDEEGDLTFVVDYRNGVNVHSTTVSIPMNFGTDKTSAVLVVNEVEVSLSGSTTTVSGDVTNAGLEEAYSVMVTVGDPATPTNPNPIAVIGALEPDDFSGFEVTYTMQGAGEVPVLVTYKDQDGNIYEEEFSVSGSSAFDADGDALAERNFAAGGPGGGARGSMSSMGSGFAQIPFIPPIILGILLIAGGLVAWRKGYLARARDGIRTRLHKEK